jgi:solute carrier family 26 (sodium-independent sulfate anion transporter), member 11
MWLIRFQDRPWNVPQVLHIEDALPDSRPTLKAIIIDCSSVDNLDLTSIQYLINVRNLLDRHAAPDTVQWHFASVFNPWAKRALAAAGFGYPSFETEDGRLQHFKPIYSLAEMTQADPERQRDRQEISKGPEGRRKSAIADDVERREAGEFITQTENIMVERLEVSKDGKITKEQMLRMAEIHGINRPFFHTDIQSALTSAVAILTVMEGTMEISTGEEKRQSEKEEKED